MDTLNCDSEKQQVCDKGFSQEIQYEIVISHICQMIYKAQSKSGT